MATIWYHTDMITAIALATSAISITIGKGKVFNPLREALGKRTKQRGRHFITSKLLELLKCPYCLSHWIAALFVFAYRPLFFDIWWEADLIVSLFAIVALANMISWVVLKSLILMDQL